MANELSSGNDNQPSVPIALKALVIVLGVIMVVMLVVLIYMVVTKKDSEPYAGSATSQPVVGGAVPHLPLDLGPGARVRQSTMERGVLTLVVETGGGDKVVLFDVKEGRVLSVLDLSAAPSQVPE
ncbi:MAG: hypothetical protein EP347_02600 [Alphaproteobacteria bacterium]|nr:MAG: hypothetical protein EP347_02600 [Alphaproteobacteria bacterium]